MNISHIHSNGRMILSFRGDAKSSERATGTGGWDDAKWRESKRTVQEDQEIISASPHDQRYLSDYLFVSDS